MFDVIINTFGAFVINVLSGKCLNEIENSDLKDRVNKAFDNALNLWSKNKDIAYKEGLKRNHYINALNQDLSSMNSSEKELMNLFIKELKNDIQTWQLLHEVNICQILSRLESQRDKFRFHDQLRINKEKHFHIYPTDETNIIDIYVEPHYEIVSTNSNKIIIGSNFVDDSLGLLDKQRCLFISGSYGCGKTFTSKYIQYSLLGNKNFTIYLYADDFEELCRQDINGLKLSLESLSQSNERIYMFIDSYDGLSSNIETEHMPIIEKLSNFLKIFPNLYLIVNFRIIEKNNECEDFYAALSLYFGDEFQLIQLKQFNKEKIEKWLERYNELSGTFYDYPTLKRSKGLLHTCSIPLFLYVYAYYNKNKNNTYTESFDIYMAFEAFITNTIRGKFNKESVQYNYLKSNKIEYKNYLQFLTNVAYKILENNGTIKIEEKDLGEYFDNNSSQLEIVEESISCIIKSTFGNRVKKADEGILKCYFFRKNGNKWGFKDNNIAYYLIANDLVNRLKELYTNRGCNIANLSKRMHNITLLPIVYEFIFFFIDKLNNQAKNEINLNILNLIKEKRILDFTGNSDSLNLNKMSLDVLFFCLFIRLNKVPLSEDLNYIFKRISHYYSFSKLINPNLGSAIRRYFKASSIVAAEFRRINLKGYNFDDSKLDHVKFIQDKITESRFNRVVFTSTVFDLCYIKKSEFEDISGEIEFKNSFLHEFSIDAPKPNSSISFYGCKIQMISINSDNVNVAKWIDIRLKNCVIEQFKLNNMKVRFYLDNCILNNKIDCKNSMIDIIIEKQEDNSEVKIEKLNFQDKYFNIDKRSKFISQKNEDE